MDYLYINGEFVKQENAYVNIRNNTFNYGLGALEGIRAYWNEDIQQNKDGTVSEGSTNNIFMVTNGKLYTPTIADNILEGITRETVINIAQQDLKLEVKEASIPKTNR